MHGETCPLTVGAGGEWVSGGCGRGEGFRDEWRYVTDEIFSIILTNTGLPGISEITPIL